MASAIQITLLILALGLAGASIFFTLAIREKMMATLTESLQEFPDTHNAAMEVLRSAVTTLLDRYPEIAAAAVSRYLADHPPATGEGGTVPDQVVIDALRDLNGQMKNLLSNAAVIEASVDNYIAHGNPRGAQVPEGDGGEAPADPEAPAT